MSKVRSYSTSASFRRRTSTRCASSSTGTFTRGSSPPLPRLSRLLFQERLIFVNRRLRRNQRLYEEKHQILSSVFSLWTRGSAYPQLGTDVLHFPFRFLLPDGLPLSFNFHALEITSAVSYTIDSVGVRRCKLRISKKFHTPVAALPKDDAGVRVRMRLRESATREPYTEWKNVWAEEKIRNGFRDKHATVRIMVSLL